MPSRTLKRLSRQLFQYTHSQIRNQIRLSVIRHYTDCDCGCKEGGKCDCGPECDCPHRKKTYRLGPRPTTSREPPSNYAPESLGTDAFEIPDFMDPKVFRPMEKGEQLGPGAHKSKTYKNPEFYSYHSLSYYDLRAAQSAAQKHAENCK